MSDLLQYLYRGLDAQVDGKPAYMTIWCKKGKESRTYWHPLTDLTGAIRDAAEADRQGYDVYLSTSTTLIRGTGKQRIKATDTVDSKTGEVKDHARPPYQIGALFMDIDTHLDPDKAGKDVPDTPEDAVADLRRLPFPPSVCVCSGNGIHAYWLINEPLTMRDADDIDRANNILRRFADRVKTTLGRDYYNIDVHASEACRVLRVDGTHNYKNTPKPVKTAWINRGPDNEPVVYSMNSLRAYYGLPTMEAPVMEAPVTAEASKPAPATITTAPMTTQETPQDGKKASTIENCLTVARHNLGKKFTDLWEGVGVSDPSEADYKLCFYLAQYLNLDKVSIDECFRDSRLIRDKWDERRGNDTYGERTINRAIDGVLHPRDRNGSILPPYKVYTPEDIDRALSFINSTQEAEGTGKRKKQRLTIEILSEELSARNITLRYNQITHDIDLNDDGIQREYKSVLTTLHSALGEYYTNTTPAILDAYMQEIAERDKYNPVIEYLNSVELVDNGVDQVDELYKLWRIPEDDWLSRALILKWLYQGYYLLTNDEFEPIGADGVLTLNGPQGGGKTASFRQLAIRPSWFLEGASITGDKDTVIRATSHWITELGEVETTLKSDIESLKNFITAPADEYRVSYGHFNEKHARRTLLCATCNSDRYLIDKTGNRRWWTVPITETVPYDEISQFDATQLWKQISVDAEGDYSPDKFRLTTAERIALDERNGDYEKLIKGEAEVLDILDKVNSAPSRYHTILISVSDWKKQYTILDRYNAEQVGTVLTKLGYNTKKRTKHDRLRELPVPLFTAVAEAEEI